LIQSMTGFASGKGAFAHYSWAWELRSVNGKGLDLRLRVPDWVEGLEAQLKAAMTPKVTRGNITLGLRLGRADEVAQLALNTVQLDSVLIAMAQVEAEAMERGLSLAPANATDILALRGVLDSASVEENTSDLAHAICNDFAPVLAAFLDMRKTEGKAMQDVLFGHLDEIERLVARADAAIDARREEMAASFRTALARVMDNADGADEHRIAQELALIAVKADVTEEIDRLGAHIAAARALLAAGGSIGRKLDFLAQEFNREANTLCSKAQSKELTSIGLDLKAVIDQLREQIQNVE